MLVSFTTAWLLLFCGCEADNAYLAPIDPVKMIGDVIEFDCRSPPNYTGFQYTHIKFMLQHNGTDIFESEAYYIIDMYSGKTFAKIVTSKQDAGNYTCIITPLPDGKVVKVDTKLVVVEASEMTEFGEMGKQTKMSCFDTKDQLTQLLVTVWSVDGEHIDQKSDSSHLVIPKTAKADAYKTYTCLVASKNAVDTYASIENARREGAVAEMSKSLSVVDIVECKDKKACVLEIIVYGETEVNITLLVDGKLLIPVPEIDTYRKMIRTETPILNIISATLIELRVTDGFNIWRKNISEVFGNCSKGCEYCTYGYCHSCYDGYYTKEAGFCRRCSANCQLCLSDKNCAKCDIGHYLQRKDKDDYFCQPCAEGCRICSSAQVCFQCDNGYFQNHNRCRRCSSNCAICESEYECRRCDDGYNLMIDDKCSKCPEEFYYSESSCLSCPINCASCFKFDECRKCKPGFYGLLCTQKCSTRCVDNVCKKSNGQCPCKVDFVGETCNLCRPGKYSSSCNLDCPTTCSACNSFKNCTICHTGYFGETCEKKCSNGCFRNICSFRTGTCDECKPGYFGYNCERNCSKGCIENTCSRKTGDCNKCKAYFKLPTCTNCVDGKWGEDCRLNCPDSCRSCLSPTECTRCKNGYHGGACEKNCSFGCSLKLCEQTTGICSQNCTKMFIGQYCDQCIEGSYGKDDCSEECPENCYNNVCDMIDGRCNEGCKPRFYGPNCDLPCPASCKLCSSNTSCQDCAVGFWGGYCQNQCPKNCLNNTCLSDEKCTLCRSGYCHSSLNCSGNCAPLSCNNDSGVCQYGCKRGYWGKWCEIECPANCLHKNCYTGNGTCKDIYLERKIGNSSATIPVGTVILFVSVAMLIIYAIVITIILVRKRCTCNRHENTMLSRDEAEYIQGRIGTRILEDLDHIYEIPEEDQMADEVHTNPDTSSVETAAVNSNMYIHPIHVLSEYTAEYESVC